MPVGKRRRMPTCCRTIELPCSSDVTTTPNGLSNKCECECECQVVSGHGRCSILIRMKVGAGPSPFGDMYPARPRRLEAPLARNGEARGACRAQPHLHSRLSPPHRLVRSPSIIRPFPCIIRRRCPTLAGTLYVACRRRKVSAVSCDNDVVVVHRAHHPRKYGCAR